MRKFEYFFVGLPLVFSLILVGVYIKKKKSRYSNRVAEAIIFNSPELGSTTSLAEVFKKIGNSNKKQQRPATDSGIKSDLQIISSRKVSDHSRNVAKNYIAKLISSSGTAELYKRLSKIYGESISGQGARDWITLAIAFDSTKEYGTAFEVSLHDANQDPKEIVAAFTKSIEVIRKDPFIYEMSLNLVRQIRLSSADQASIYGAEIQYQLEHLSQGSPDNSFWVAMLGITLAQQSGVKTDQISKYFVDGLASSKGNKDILNDIKKSATLHFPTIKL